MPDWVYCMLAYVRYRTLAYVLLPSCHGHAIDSHLGGPRGCVSQLRRLFLVCVASPSRREMGASQGSSLRHGEGAQRVQSRLAGTDQPRVEGRQNQCREGPAAEAGAVPQALAEASVVPYWSPCGCRMLLTVAQHLPGADQARHGVVPETRNCSPCGCRALPSSPVRG